MSVRKRSWKSGDVTKCGCQADYVDAKGKRRRKMFGRKKEAAAFAVTAAAEVRDGVHVADAETVTIETAGELWLKSGEANRLERGTLDQRRQHLSLHIVPLIGDTRLNRLTVPGVREFQDRLREAGRSADMVKRVTVSLGSILADAQGRGLTIRNPVHERARARSGAGALDRRAKGRLIVGVDIPSRDEVKALLTHPVGRWRPLLVTAIFTGMRSSELRGLTWANVDLDNRQIHVRQRADLYNAIGRPKSEAGERSLPIPPLVANTLKEWRLGCPKGALGLVFPNGAGNVETRGNIAKRGLIPAMLAAGVTKLGADASQVAKYTGLHAFRHFYASWCINPVSAGGQALSPKTVQDRLGHSSITMTMDTYGHLFPAGDDRELLAAAERSLLG